MSDGRKTALVPPALFFAGLVIPTLNLKATDDFAKKAAHVAHANLSSADGK